MKLHFLGFGAVARSLVRMIRDRGTFPLPDIAVIDRAEDAGDALAGICGPSGGFTRAEIRRDNLDEVLRNVKAGDIVFNLGDMLGARAICAWCLKRNVHYLSASSDDFPDGELATPSFTYDEYAATRRMFDAVRSPAPATVVSSGMNPGAVSLFAKRAIAELSGEEPTDFAAAARKLGVASVDITDIDDTELRVPREPFVVYSTWSPREFFVESTVNAEVTVGCGVPTRPADEPAEFADAASGFVAFKAPAYERPVRTVGLGREGGLVAFTGATVAHDEIVSIPAYLTVREGGRVVYRPESRFIYRACAAARASVAEIVASGMPPRGYHLITADEIASGGEAVGVLVTLLNGEAVYVGTRYDLADVPHGETPTVFQVAAGCHAALCHVLANPQSGPRFPEELDTRTFLASSGLPVRVIRASPTRSPRYFESSGFPSLRPGRFAERHQRIAFSNAPSGRFTSL